MIRVAVAGALGRMGRVACAAVAAAGDMSLVGGVARAPGGEPLLAVLGIEGHGGRIYGDAAALCAAEHPDVLVDFTVHPATVDVAKAAVEAGAAAVVGATGWNASERDALARLCQERGGAACLIPNFAVGAVLMMRFAEQAAPFFPTAEIVELHHDAKRDAPSGTSKLTAARIAAASGGRDVPIHSVRLRGLVAHQEALFGGTGELLTIRHDSLSRESFAAGILLAVRGIGSRPGLTIGLDAFLDAIK